MPRFGVFIWAMIACVMLPSLGQGQAHVTKEPVSNDGTPVQVDLPKVLHMKNVGGSDGPRGPGSGSGLCVFTSVNLSAHYQNVPALQDFQKWMMYHPGGGYPSKLDKMIDRMCKEKGFAKPDYLNIETNDLEIIKLALRTGRMCSVTYGISPTGRYSGRRIAHMVNLYAAGAGKGPDGKGWYCVQDNNMPGTYEWMSESQFLRAYTSHGKGWVVVLLRNPPAPVPYH